MALSQKLTFPPFPQGGWAGMTRERLDPELDTELIAYAEAHIFELPAAPHTWLFPRCGAVVHHGGAGTLAAGLKVRGQVGISI